MSDRKGILKILLVELTREGRHIQPFAYSSMMREGGRAGGDI